MTQSTDYHARDGLRTRGTVIVVPGRGETRATYARFGSRLACDAYRVRVVDLPTADPAAVAPFLDALARRLSEAVAGIAAEASAGLPRPLVGDADPLADRDAVARAAKTLPKARLTVVRGAHHDVLNDLQHRSVAAEVVTFLEALRNELAPAITVETSAW